MHLIYTKHGYELMEISIEKFSYFVVLYKPFDFEINCDYFHTHWNFVN